MAKRVELGEIVTRSMPRVGLGSVAGPVFFMGTQIFLRAVVSSKLGGWKRMLCLRLVPRYLVLLEIQCTPARSRVASTWCQESSGRMEKMSLWNSLGSAG